MVDRLRLAGAAAIAFDVVFPEPDRTSPGVYADSLSNVEAGVVEALPALPNNAEVLAQALSQTRLVLGQSGYHRDAGRKGNREIGRAHVCTPVTNAHLVCRLRLEKTTREK